MSDLLSTQSAADYAGVPVHIIKTWGRLGLIVNYGGGGKGSHALWDRNEVRTAPLRRRNLRIGFRGRAVTDAERAANKRLATGRHLNPPGHLPYRALAYTCGKCGDLISPTSIYKSDKRVMRHHECDNISARQRRADNPNTRAVLNARSKENYQARQGRSLDGASRRGYEWTGPELEVASRSDLTTEEVALMLGRTLAGVMWVRKQFVVGEVKKRRLAGLSEPETGNTPRPLPQSAFEDAVDAKDDRMVSA